LTFSEDRAQPSLEERRLCAMAYLPHCQYDAGWSIMERLVFSFQGLDHFVYQRGQFLVGAP